MRTTVAFLIALVAACAGRGDRLVDRFEEPSAMRAAILELAPLGTPLREAAARLGAQGFRCQPPTRGTFGSADSVSYAYCSGSSETRAFVSRRWQLALVDSVGRLADVRATTGLVGP